MAKVLRPVRPPADPAPMQREAVKRWISGTSTSSPVPGVGKSKR
ncbi:hypothetical protein HMPREF9056_00219 [Actinomyces sp. oral taxon 170 str. F0386]|nr:hypothetical protein HMPREF9056_00219 [Actinomyces sp. oral taxon 170 str. F0386]